jgi:cell wall-associated NlpC family hydrolase
MLQRLLIFTLIIITTCSVRAQGKGSTATAATETKTITEVNRTDLITVAKEYLGTPYRRGSTNPKKGFDCSGFVYFIFNKFNVTLPRSSKEYKKLGTALKPEEFKVGDVLVFYGFKDNTRIGHVGIICEANGMNSRFIHSSSGKAYGVTISDLGSAGYKRRFYKCIDVLGK